VPRGEVRQAGPNDDAVLAQLRDHLLPEQLPLPSEPGRDLREETREALQEREPRRGHRVGSKRGAEERTRHGAEKGPERRQKSAEKTPPALALEAGVSASGAPA